MVFVYIGRSVGRSLLWTPEAIRCFGPEAFLIERITISALVVWDSLLLTWLTWHISQEILVAGQCRKEDTAEYINRRFFSLFTLWHIEATQKEHRMTKSSASLHAA